MQDGPKNMVIEQKDVRIRWFRNSFILVQFWLRDPIKIHFNVYNKVAFYFFTEKFQ